MTDKNKQKNLLDSSKSISVLNHNTPSTESIAVGIDLSGKKSSFGQSKYDKSDTSADVIISGEYNYYRGERQDNWDKAANGLGRMAGRALGSFVNSTAGLIYGVGMVVSDPNHKFSNLYDNNITRSMDKMNEAIDESAPLYQTRDYENASLGSKLLKANLWFGDVLSGIGYTAGSIATGALSSSAFKGIAKLALSGRTDLIKKAAITGEDVLKVVEDGAKVRLNAANEFTSSILSAVGEAGDNARQGKDQFLQKRLEEVKAEYSAKGMEVPESVVELLKLEAEKLGNATFFANLPIIAGANFLQFGKAMTNMGAEKKAASEMFGEVSEKIIKNKVTGEFEKKAVSNFEKRLNATGKLLSSPIEEGTQEQLQKAIDVAADDFYTKRFQGKDTSFEDLVEASVKGLKDAYGTEDGWTNFVVGALSAGITGAATPGSEFQQALKSDDKSVNAALTILNKYKTDPILKELIQSNKRASEISEDMTDAALKNDKFEFNNKQNDLLTSWVLSRVKTGQYESLQEDLDNLKTMSPEDFKKTFGVNVKESNKNSVLEFVQDRINKANEIKDIYENITEFFPKLSEGNKERMIHAGVTISDVKNRRKELNRQFNDILLKDQSDIALGAQINNITDVKTFKEALDNSEINPVKKQQLEKIWEDITKLKEREKKYVDLYNSLLDPTVQKVNDVKDVISQEQKQKEPTAKTVDDQKGTQESTSNNKERTISLNDQNWLPENTFKKEGKEFINLRNVDNKDVVISIPIEQYNAVANKTNLVENEGTTEGIDEETVDNVFVHSDENDYQFGATGKLATTVYKTESGWDILNERELIIAQRQENEIAAKAGRAPKRLSTNTPSRERWYRFIEKHLAPGHRLLVVTKNNNLTLYNEILDDRPEAKAFEEKTPDYQGIYVVIVNQDNTPARIDGKLVSSTLTLPDRVKKGELAIADKETAIKELTAFREKLLAAAENVYLDILAKSKGIPVLTKNENGQRSSRSVVGRIVDNIQDLELSLPVTKPSFSKVDAFVKSKDQNVKQSVLRGKLYGIFNQRVFELIPRNVNQEEIEMILDLMAQKAGIKPTTVDNPGDELDKIILFGVPKKGPNRFTLGIKDNIVQVGLEQLTIEQFATKEGQDKVRALLSNKRTNVNNGYLNTTGTFFGPTTSGKGKEYSNYQEYLLSGENPMFGTDLAAKSETQFRNQYIVYDSKTNQTTLEEGKGKISEVEADPFANVVATSQPIEVVNNDKKADIERRRQEELNKIYSNLETDKSLEDLINILQNYDIAENFEFITQIFKNNNVKVSFDGKHAGGLPKVASIDTGVINGKLSIILTINKSTFDKLSKKQKIEVIAHEFVHGLIKLKLNEKGDLKGTSFYNGLNNIFKEVKDFYYSGEKQTNKNNFDFLKKNFTQQELNDLGGKIRYIESSIEEFATLGLTDPIVSKFLKLLQGKGETKKENLWTNLAKLVSDFIGISNTKFNELLNFISSELDTNINYTDKINAKYDAELDALENNKPTLTKKVFKKKEEKPLNKERKISDENKPLISQEEINWFRTSFPNIPIEIIQGLIENKNFGRFLSSAKVLLSDKAVVGTLRHEAFHTVTQLYLTKAELDKLYKEAKSISGISDRFDLEELLANDYENYRQTGKILKNRPVRNNLFRKLTNFLKDLLGIKASSIEDIYRRLDKGYYKNKDVVGVREFTSLNKAVKERSESWTKELLDELDSKFFDIIYENGLTPNVAYSKSDEVFNRLFNKYDEKYNEIFNKYEKGDKTSKTVSLIEDYEHILANWNDIKSKWVERINSIGFEIESNDKDLNEDDSEGSEEERSEREWGFQEANQKSTKDSMFKSTRMLIRSLKTNELNSRGERKTVDFNSTYNFLLKNLEGVGSSYEDLYKRLEILSQNKPEIKELMERLGPAGSLLSMKKQLHQTQFLQDFNKTRIDSFITKFSADGRIYVVDANRQGEAGKVKLAWEGNIRNVAELTDNGKLVVDKDVAKIADSVSFLNSIGIELSKEAILKKDNSLFEKAVEELRNYVFKNNGDITNLYSRDQDLGRLNYLLELEAANSSGINELSFISTEGKTVYSINYNNALTIIGNIINNSKTKQELFDRLPHLDTESNRNSVWLNSMFDKDGIKIEGKDINIDLYDGAQTEDTIEKSANSTRKLGLADLMSLQINNTLLQGKTSFIVSADKSSEFSISLSNFGKNKKLPIAIEDVKEGFDKESIKSIFRGYFRDEVTRIAQFELDGLGSNIAEYNKKGKNFTIFDFLPTNIKNKVLDLIETNKKDNKKYIDSIDDLNTLHNELSDDLNTAIVNFFDTYFKEEVKNLNEFKVLEHGISKDLLDNYSTEQLLRAFIVNDMINSIEQTKLFIGNLAFYKDLYKRTAGFAGTKELPRVDSAINGFLNNNNKRKDEKPADGQINVAIFEDIKVNRENLDKYIKALIDSGVSESLVNDILEAYTKMDEGDAQGWITLDEYREFNIRLGVWNEKLEEAFEKAQNGKVLSSDEVALFLTLKAQYAGPQSYNGLFVPTYHKFSLMPLLPQLTKDKNLDILSKKMTEKKIGYALFRSGSKVGTILDENNNANRFYTKGNHGEINTGNWITQKISYNFLGLQVKSSNPKDKVIFGTQFRKLLWNNIFENGKPLFEGAQELFNEYNAIINEQIEYETEKLLKELGINQKDYTPENVSNLVKLLQKEAKDRKLPDNIIDALKIEEIKSKILLSYKFDSMVNKDKIDSMLMAIVETRLIKQKTNGDSYIQGAVSGFEQIGKREIGTSNALEFYEVDEKTGKTNPAECKIVMSKNYKPLLKKYKTLENLNKAIKEGKIEEEVLRLVGYRIPTQGHNSMEFLKITEFLPEESGTLIVLPTELVAKSGGDFDIDKLNVFRASLSGSEYVNTSLTNSQIKEKATSIYNSILYKFKNIESVISEEKERFYDELNDGTPESNIIRDIFNGITEERLEQEILGEIKITAEDLKRFKQVVERKDDFIDNYIDTYKKKQRENRLIEISTEVLSHESMLASLITPNSSKILSDLADDIKYERFLNKKRKEALDNKEEFKTTSKEEYIKTLKSQEKNIYFSKSLKFSTKAIARFKLWLAKDEVGIAAVANTFGTLAQIADINLNKSYIDKEGNIVPVSINLPHNETSDGKLDMARLKDSDGKNSLSEINSQILNVTVDAAKEEEPIIFHLNMTMDTLPVYLYLNRMGVPFDTLSYFMTQPIIMEYLQGVNRNKATFLKAKGKNLSTKDVLEKVKSNYSKNLSKEEIENREDRQLNSEELKSYLNTDNHQSKEFKLAQLQILKDFLAYKEQAGLLSDFVKTINSDTAGLGQNLNSLRLREKLKEKVKNTGFVNNGDKVIDKFVGKFDKDSMVIKMYEPFYNTQSKEISDNSLHLFEEIIKANFKNISAKNKNKLLKLIDNDFINFVVQNYGYESVENLHTSLFTSDKGESVAKELLRIKKDNSTEGKKLSDNMLIKELFPLFAKNKDGVDNVKIYTKRYDTFTYNQLTEAFEEVRRLKPDFAERLMDLGILQSGLNNSPITYLGLIPYSYYNEIVKKAFEKFNNLDNKQDILSRFNQLFIRNNYTDPVVYYIARKLKLGNLKIKTYDQNGNKVTTTLTTGLGNGIYGKDYNNKKYDSKLANIPNNINTFTKNKAMVIQPTVSTETKTLFELKNDSLDNKLVNFINSLIPGYIKSTKDKLNIVAELASLRALSFEPNTNKELIDGGKMAEKLLKNYTPKELKEENRETLDNMIANVVLGKLAESGLSEQDIWYNLFDKNKLTTTTVSTPVANIPQNKVSGIESFGSTVTANAEAIKALGTNPHSIDMIEAGFRTRTTRSESEMSKYAIKVGDIIKHFGKSADGTTKNILARVTAIHPKGSAGWKGSWAKEGWRAEDVNVIDRFKDGAAAIEFEVIKPTVEPTNNKLDLFSDPETNGETENKPCGQ